MSLPGQWAQLGSFERMCVLRCLRPDKCVPGIQAYVKEQMGQPYIGLPPPFKPPAVPGAPPGMVPPPPSFAPPGMERQGIGMPMPPGFKLPF